MGDKKSIIIFLCLILVLASLFVQGVSAITVYSGDTVELSGGALGSDYVYLFLTGPNLPSNGVSPEDISSEVQTGVSSSFTRVSTGNNVWKYKWDTNTAGSTPDTGNYAVYAVNSPSGRNDLAGKEYAVIQLTLKDPFVSAQAETRTLQTQTAEITPEIVYTKSAENDVGSPTATIPEPSQATQAAGSFGIIMIALLISSVLLFGIKKR